MARLIPTLVTLAATVALAACNAARDDEEASGVQSGKTVAVDDFRSLQLAGPFDVKVATGVQPSVTVNGPQEVLDKLVVEVKNNELSIRLRRGANISTREAVTIAVNVPQLAAATIAGSGDIAIDKLAGDAFDGTIAGAGSLELGRVTLKTLELSIAGSGDVTGSGTADKADHSIAGAGNIRLASVASREVEVSIAGSGDVEVQASQTAEVSIMGSGDVRVTGGAKCKVSKMGSGRVICS